jgi:hypothetical protein
MIAQEIFDREKFLVMWVRRNAVSCVEVGHPVSTDNPVEEIMYGFPADAILMPIEEISAEEARALYKRNGMTGHTDAEQFRYYKVVAE